MIWMPRSFQPLRSSTAYRWSGASAMASGSEPACTDGPAGSRYAPVGRRCRASSGADAGFVDAEGFPHAASAAAAKTTAAVRAALFTVPAQMHRDVRGVALSLLHAHLDEAAGVERTRAAERIGEIGGAAAVAVGLAADGHLDVPDARMCAAARVVVAHRQIAIARVEDREADARVPV